MNSGTLAFSECSALQREATKETMASAVQQVMLQRGCLTHNKSNRICWQFHRLSDSIEEVRRIHNPLAWSDWYKREVKARRNMPRSAACLY